MHCYLYVVTCLPDHTNSRDFMEADYVVNFDTQQTYGKRVT